MTTPESIGQKKEGREEPTPTGWTLALAAVVILLLIAIFTHRKRVRDIESTPAQNNQPVSSVIYTTPAQFKLCRDGVTALNRAHNKLKEAGFDENGPILTDIQSIVESLKMVEVAHTK